MKSNQRISHFCTIIYYDQTNQQYINIYYVCKLIENSIPTFLLVLIICYRISSRFNKTQQQQRNYYFLGKLRD